MKVPDSIWRWIFFGVVVSLIPFILQLLLLFVGKPFEKEQNPLFNGDILLVSSAFAAGGAGELTRRTKTWTPAAVGVLCGCVSAVALSSGVYGHVSQTVK